jgi:hypothetical protein
MIGTTAKLEVTVKFTELPDALEVQGGHRVEFDCDGIQVITTVRPRSWGRLQKAAVEYSHWVAAISGTMGAPVKGRGFLLENAALQIFEKKPKPAEPPPTPPAPETAEAPPAAVKRIGIGLLDK